MRKEYTIRVAIDDSLPTDGTSWISPSRDDMYIDINPKRVKTLENTLAHELGHVVSRIALTSAFVNDPRLDRWYALENAFGYSDRTREGVLRNEKEAWKFAEIMLGDKLDKEDERLSIDSYER
jgi:hypothetical protein